MTNPAPHELVATQQWKALAQQMRNQPEVSNQLHALLKNALTEGDGEGIVHLLKMTRSHSTLKEWSLGSHFALAVQHIPNSMFAKTFPYVVKGLGTPALLAPIVKDELIGVMVNNLGEPDEKFNTCWDFCSHLCDKKHTKQLLDIALAHDCTNVFKLIFSSFGNDNTGGLLATACFRKNLELANFLYPHSNIKKAMQLVKTRISARQFFDEMYALRQHQRISAKIEAVEHPTRRRKM